MNSSVRRDNHVDYTYVKTFYFNYTYVKIFYFNYTYVKTFYLIEMTFI